MAMGFLYSLTIDMTNGKYYSSSARCLLVPWNVDPAEALSGCTISGRLSLYDNSYGQELIEEDTVSQAVKTDGYHNTQLGRLEFKIVSISWNQSFKSGYNYFKLTLAARFNGTNYPITAFTSSYYNREWAQEATPSLITITDDKKNLSYGDTNSLGGSMTIKYAVGDDVVLSGTNMDNYLIANLCTVQHKGVSLTYPNNFTIDETFFYGDYAQEVVYNMPQYSFTQRIAVKYISSFLLSYTTETTGTKWHPIYSDANGISIDKSSVTAHVTIKNNRYENGSFVTSSNGYTVSGNNLVWSKDTFSVQDIIDLNDNPYNITITYNYNGSFQQTCTQLLTVYLAIKHPVSAVINGADETLNYYQNEDSYFVTPSFTQNAGADELITFVYSDNSTKDIDPDEIDTIEYMLTNDGTGTALVAGSSIISAAYNQLYVKITLLNGEVAYAPFNIYRKVDTVASITCTPNFYFVLGNKLDKYKGTDIQVTAHWTNPAKADTSNFTDFTFDYTSIVMTNADLGASTNIHIGSTQFTISLANVSYTAPDVDYVEITRAVGIRKSYQNVLDSIDITAVKLLVHYEDAEYTKEVVFNTSDNSVDYSHYSVKIHDIDSNQQILNNINYINGTTALDLADTTAIYNCKFQFTIKNEFTAVSAVELEATFSIVSLQKLTGIRILQAYRDYKVGEEFLNDDDDTIVRLFYEAVDAFGTIYTDSADIYLRDDIPTISVNYAKGTEWTQPDSSKRIVVSSVFDSTISAEYTIEVTYDGVVSGSRTNDLVVIWEPYVTFVDGSSYSEPNGILCLYPESDTEVINGIRSLKAGVQKLQALRGYIKNIFNTKMLDAQAVLVLIKDYNPPIEGSANITINFPSYSGLADNINKCQFGILFGNNNANNRLFVSGNPEIRNADWHSGETNIVHIEGEAQSINGDFSYFPNENVMYYGETDNKIVGYDIVSNDKLLVLKDKSDKEKTVYFRTPTLVTALDATGATVTDVQGNNLYQEEFALVKGNNSVAGVSPHSIINLNGDTLFIDSDNTVQGLDLTGIVGDNQRYANTRSAYLDQLLKELDLSKSFLWTNNKYLFMPVKDEGLFVTHIDAFGGENKQYEWWRLQCENPTCFVEIDNKIYFGNEKGEMFRMRNGEYCDEYKVFVNEGQGILAIINEEEYPKVIDGVEIPAESIVVNQDIFNQLFPADNPYYVDGEQVRHLYFRSINTGSTYIGSMFYQIGSITNDATASNIDYLIKQDTTDNIYYLEIAAKTNGKYDPEKELKLIGLTKENKEYYINYYKEAGVQEVKCNTSSKFYNNYNNKFRLIQVPSTGNERYLMEIWNTVTEAWENINLGDLYKANLVSKLEGDYELGDVDSTTYSFRLKDDNGDNMNIVNYGNQGVTSTFQAEIVERKNITAYYALAPLTAGNVSYFKTFWSFTFTNDTGKPSTYELAIASNKIPDIKSKTIASVSKAKIGTNFSDFTFEAVDFDKDVVPRTYTIQRTLGMQKYVCLVFKNSSNANSILSSLSVIYTLPFPSYGSD